MPKIISIGAGDTIVFEFEPYALFDTAESAKNLSSYLLSALSEVLNGVIFSKKIYLKVSLN
jgi:hypothetical protein